MANKEHLAKLNEGVEAWNQWRKVNPEIETDLESADLMMAKISSITSS